MYDLCGNNEYRDESYSCKPIIESECEDNQIHFLGIPENHNTGYPQSDEYITYDDITSGTYESYDSTCYPGIGNKYFEAKENYTRYFSP